MIPAPDTRAPWDGGGVTIAEFLLERIAEDGASAREAADALPGKWASWNRSWDHERRDLAADHGRVATIPIGADEHIARHDPARVLAECAAKRAIVDEHDEVTPGVLPRGVADTCGRCADVEEADFGGTPMVRWPCPTLRHLAAVYADHPDYRDEWHV